MTIDQLRSQETFQLLTDKEQAFLCHYLLTEGDWSESVLKAYPSTNPKNIRQTINRLRTRPFIMQLIRMIDGTHIPDKNEILQELWETSQQSEGAAKVAALHLFARLSGHLDKQANSTPDIQQLMSELDSKRNAN